MFVLVFFVFLTLCPYFNNQTPKAFSLVRVLRLLWISDFFAVATKSSDVSSSYYSPSSSDVAVGVKIAPGSSAAAALCRSGPCRPLQLFPVSQTQKLFTQLLLWKLIYGLQLLLNLLRLRRPVYHTRLTSSSGRNRFPGFLCCCFFYYCFRKFCCCDFCVSLSTSFRVKPLAGTQTH